MINICIRLENNWFSVFIVIPNRALFPFPTTGVMVYVYKFSTDCVDDTYGVDCSQPAGCNTTVTGYTLQAGVCPYGCSDRTLVDTSHCEIGKLLFSCRRTLARQNRVNCCMS